MTSRIASSRILVAIAVAAAPFAFANPSAATEDPDCNSRAWNAASRAVDAWCEGTAPVERPYADWSLDETRVRACDDLRDALASCSATVTDAKNYGASAGPGLMVLAQYPEESTTYWQARLVPRGRGYRVTWVDVLEDNTP